jgi:phage shock protein PspC (stress-responsive transcriptional regulator)
MKKTLSINIAGIVFHIEEDAYAQLDSYIQSIHSYFESFEGSKEIIADIEARIAEKFWSIREHEKTEAITEEHVKALIAALGTVADFQEVEMEDDKKENAQQTKATSNSSEKLFNSAKPFRRDISRKQIGGVAAGLANYFNLDPIWIRLILLVGFFGLLPLLHVGNFVFWAYIICWIAIPGELNLTEDKSYRKFYRDPEKKVIGGVISGIAAYTGWDVGLLRVFAVISAIFFGSGIVAYLVILAISPEAKTLTDKMEMSGEPITLENIEKNIKETIQPNKEGETFVTRLLLFPFRIFTIVFSWAKPVIHVFRWFFQYTLGIVLIIIALAFTIALVALSTAGYSGMDHGQISLAFGEAIPIFLLAQDLPAWSIWAAYAAVIPMVVGIGIGGVSLLANRKFYNRSYKYISTTMAIVGWIGLFAAFAFVGRNFQRTASVNVVKEISADSAVNFQINRVSNESIWEKLLGSNMLAEEFLDEDEQHDYNRDGFSRAQITMEGYDGKTIQVIQYAKSNGNSRIEAENFAKGIQYAYQQKGQQLLFDTHFGLKNFKFRNQRLRVKILVPYGKPFGMSKEFAHFIDNLIDGGYFRDDEDLFVGSQWTFSVEKGLICLNRAPKDFNENSSSENKEGDSKPEFEITKSLADFNSIEMPNSESASIKIVQGPAQITFKSENTSFANFDSMAKVENGILKFPDVQSGLEITIQTPSLTKLDLGGNARTELSGFKSDQLSVVLHGFHSLTLQGNSKVLAASAFDSSELLASDWETEKALVSIGNQAKMDLNATKSIQGMKGPKSDVNIKSNPNVVISWKNSKGKK